MSGVLKLPRVEVFWGSVNLTFYEPSASWSPNGEPQPLVYDCTAKQSHEGSTPSGSMRWVPTGPAFAVYEEFISSQAKLAETITMRFYYANGRSITWSFVWAGHRTSHGNQMGIEIKLVSELEGIFNTVTRNVAQSNEDSGAPATEVLSKGEKQFGTEGIFQYTKKAKEDNTKFLIRDNYSEDVTLTSFGKNILEQGGDYAMPNAIGKAGIIVHTPYSWDTEPIAEPAGDPDPSKRYGYFLGPSIYNSIERSYEWEPPQVSTGSQSDSQTRVTPAKGSVIASWYGPGFIGNKTANGEVFTGAGQTAAHKSLPFGTKVKVTNQNNGLSTVVTINDRGPYIAGRELDLSQAAAQKIGMTSSGTAPVTMEILNKPQADNKGLVSKPTTAPVGTFGAKPNPGVRSFENPNGPKKQEMGREEGQATLSVSTLMVPALVGVKPIDVLFIPAFDGGFIEDWKVTDVEYAQSGGSGEITVSIQASRIYGSGSLMNKVGEEWLQKANSLGLVGENASIANWERYAWKLDGSSPAPNSSSDVKSGEIGGATIVPSSLGK